MGFGVRCPSLLCLCYVNDITYSECFALQHYGGPPLPCYYPVFNWHVERSAVYGQRTPELPPSLSTRLSVAFGFKLRSFLDSICFVRLHCYGGGVTLIRTRLGCCAAVDWKFQWNLYRSQCKLGLLVSSVLKDRISIVDNYSILLEPHVCTWCRRTASSFWWFVQNLSMEQCVCTTKRSAKSFRKIFISDFFPQSFKMYDFLFF